MTKYRESLSIEFVLSQVIKKLDDEEIKNFTGKSISHYRKCSDPEDKDHTLHLKDAIQLDILMQKNMLGTPFLDLINLNLTHEFRKINDYENVKNIHDKIAGGIPTSKAIRGVLEPLKKFTKKQLTQKIYFLNQWRKTEVT